MNNIFKGAALFVNGYGNIANLESITFPSIAIQTEEFEGGTLSPKSIDMLGVEAMTLSFKTNNIDQENLKLISKDNSSFVIKGSLQDDGGNFKSFEAVCRGMLKKIDLGDLSSFKKSSTSHETANLNYFKLKIDDSDICEIDTENLIRKINGVDQLEQFRNNLGA